MLFISERHILKGRNNIWALIKCKKEFKKVAGSSIDAILIKHLTNKIIKHRVNHLKTNKIIKNPQYR